LLSPFLLQQFLLTQSSAFTGLILFIPKHDERVFQKNLICCCTAMIVPSYWVVDADVKVGVDSDVDVVVDVDDGCRTAFVLVLM
jgi:hypothetical protein